MSNPMQTIDMRGGGNQPREHEVGKRAEARKAAAKRKAARKEKQGHQPKGAGGSANMQTVGGCARLVGLAMKSVTGELVGDSDDLFDAGLSSVSVTRLRGQLSRETGIELPETLIYDHTTVRSLAAAIYCLKLASSPDGTGAASVDCMEGVAAAPLLMANAKQKFREGALDAAEAACVRVGSSCLGLSDEWTRRENLLATEQLLSSPTFVECDETVPMLSLLVSIWMRRGLYEQAVSASHLLVSLSSQKSANAAESLDVALLWAQLAMLSAKLKDARASASAASMAKAVGAANSARECLENMEHRTAAQQDARHAGAIGGAGATATAGGEEAGGKVCERGPEDCIATRMFEPCMTCALLTTVVLRNQMLRRIPACVGELYHLQVLDVSVNMIEALPASFGYLNELRELLLASNFLSVLPDWVAELEQLNVLNIQANYFAALPPVVLRCKRLCTLRWCGQLCDTMSIEGEDDATAGDEAEFDNISDDDTDDYGGGAAAAVATPAAPAQLLSPDLKVLAFNGNKQQVFPALHPGNTVLTTVLAAYNELATVPAELEPFGGTLRVLHIGTNSIARGDALQTLAYLTNLTCLKLDGNGLLELPGCVGKLIQLRELTVYGNCLKALPDEIKECTRLEEIDAHHNQLETLPAGLALLKKMKNLYFSANNLTNLEELRSRCFNHLPALGNLGLGANSFDSAEAFALPGVRVGLGWNAGVVPEQFRGVLNAQLATTDHVYEPAAKGAVGDVLVVAFAGQGVGNQQWASPCAAVRAAGIALDALYLADPSNSYYLQCPAGKWQGIDHFGKVISEYAQHYTKVMLVGSSMGGTAALVHARAGGRVLAFGPKVCMDRTHGSYLPSDVRDACNDALFDALDDVDDAVVAGGGAGGANAADGAGETAAGTADDAGSDGDDAHAGCVNGDACGSNNNSVGKDHDCHHNDHLACGCAEHGSSENGASENGAPEDRPSEDQPSENGATEDQPSKDQPSVDQPSVDQPSEETSSEISPPRKPPSRVISVHVGGENLEDVLQVERVEQIEGVHVVHHPTFHHNVPMFLEREGALVPLFKKEVLALMLS